MVVDRINRAILNFIRKRSGAAMGPIVTDANCVTLMRGEAPAWSIPWAQIQRITALHYPGYVGDTLMMTIEATGQSQFVSEEHEGWSEFTRELPIHLPGALPFEKWSLALVAGGEDAKVTVFGSALGTT